LTNKLVLENLKFRPVRTALSVAAIALEVMMMLAIVGLSRGTLAESQRRAQGIGADIFIRPRGSSILSFSSASIDERLVGWVKKQPHVTQAVGAIYQPLKGLDSICGIDLEQFRLLSGGFQFITGGPPRTENELMVDRYYARQNGLRVGSTLNVLNRDWRVSGIFEEGKLARIVVPIEILQRLTANSGKISAIYVKVDAPGEIQPAVDFLKSKLEGYPIYSIEELLSLYTVNNTPGLSAFISVIVGLSVVVGFLVVFLSMYTSVLERTREIGILKALGASPGYVLSILLRETAILALLGLALGILASYGTRWLVATFIPASLNQHIVPDWWPIAGAIALGGALLGAAYPGLRAARQDPIEALAYE
jgi:putative ABC transport system permease protein